jgi:hypothetical protein
MFDRSTLVASLLVEIKNMQKGAFKTKPLFKSSMPSIGKNQWLFFIKPEITKVSGTVKIESIVDLIVDKLEAWNFNIQEVSLLSAEYLGQYDLIRQHYGVIDEVATNGVRSLTASACEQFKQIYNVEPDAVKVLGGLEFLTDYAFFNAHSLDCLWQNAENLKLASGTYVEKLRVDLETIYLLNAFHPRQLEHFTTPGRGIVAFYLTGDCSWADSRNLFVGATNPQKAEPASLRRILYERRDELGLPEFSQSFNGVHLSAGPVEALIELRRFLSDYAQSDGLLPYSAFPFGKALTEKLGSIPEALLNNETVTFESIGQSVFDLTECLDADEALDRLLSIYRRSK